jgi:hypothetical protein
LTERTNNTLFLLLLGVALWSVLVTIKSSGLPEPWSWSQSITGEYEVQRDWVVFKTGNASVRISSKADDPKGYANLRQEFLPLPYLGRRVRMVAYTKTALSSGSAYLWLHVYGPNGATLSADDMGDKRITGVTDWTRHEMVMEVPKEALRIAFGFIFSGKGEAWVDDFNFQMDDEDAGATDTGWLQGPAHLGFE